MSNSSIASVAKTLGKLVVVTNDIRPYLYDPYGNRIEYLYQGRLMYSVPNSGQIARHHSEQSFFDYSLVTEEGVSSGLHIQMDVEQAQRFATLNKLKMLTFFEREEILERLSPFKTEVDDD